MTTESFRLAIPLISGATLPVELRAGSVLFLLGANGTGKSSLVHHFYAANSARAQRMSAHRQTWMQSGSVAMTGHQRRSTSDNVRSWDSQADSRWLEHGTSERASMAVYDLVDAQNTRARGIADAVDADDAALVEALRRSDAPITTLNEILRLSSIPIVISLARNDELLASKSGCVAYTIAKLSDGERNVLLLAANVLTAKAGTLIIIDEPERHIHRAISSPLLSQLFSRRPDCAFVVSTHEVMLPLDTPSAKTLLVRACSQTDSTVRWDADLLDAPPQLDEKLVADILGARRVILFVEGTKASLDLPLYSLIFPSASVVAKATCRDVEQSVVGIRDAESLVWVRAFGIVDGGARPVAEFDRLKARGIYPVNGYSVESVYYHPVLQKRVAGRHATTLGTDPEVAFADATNAALNALEAHKTRLCERVAEKAIRESFMANMPGRKEVATRAPIAVTIDVDGAVSTELLHFERALAAADISALIKRYPVRDTPALHEIALRLGFQNRNQYEAAVRKLLLDDDATLRFVQSLFSELVAAMS